MFLKAAEGVEGDERSETGGSVAGKVEGSRIGL